MVTRVARCGCGQLRLDVDGDPVRVSVCHCLACQRRTGSAFSAQARFPSERVRVTGRLSEFVRRSDGDGEERRFRFCPDCGGTVFFTTGDSSDLVAVPVGAFADPTFPPPSISVWEARRHPWVRLTGQIDQHLE